MRSVLIKSVQIKECVEHIDYAEVHRMQRMPSFDGIRVNGDHSEMTVIEKAFFRHFRRPDGTDYKVAFTEEVDELIGGYFSDYENAFTCCEADRDYAHKVLAKYQSRMERFIGASLFSRLKMAFKGEII